MDTITETNLDELNRQLLAHGYEILSDPDEIPQDVVRCLFSLLNQRLNDLSHRETLSGKLRQSYYDLERNKTLLEKEKNVTATRDREIAVYQAKLE